MNMNVSNLTLWHIRPDLQNPNAFLFFETKDGVTHLKEQQLSAPASEELNLNDIDFDVIL